MTMRSIIARIASIASSRRQVRIFLKALQLDHAPAVGFRKVQMTSTAGRSADGDSSRSGIASRAPTQQGAVSSTRPACPPWLACAVGLPAANAAGPASPMATGGRRPGRRDAVGAIVSLFSPTACAIYFKAAG